jgi:hypothetical protein
MMIAPSFRSIEVIAMNTKVGALEVEMEFFPSSVRQPGPRQINRSILCKSCAPINNIISDSLTYNG